MARKDGKFRDPPFSPNLPKAILCFIAASESVELVRPYTHAFSAAIGPFTLHISVELNVVRHLRKPPITSVRHSRAFAERPIVNLDSTP